MEVNEFQFLNRVIEIQKSAIRVQLALAGIAVALGLGVIVVGQTTGHVLEPPLTIGGSLLSSTATFPVKGIFLRKERIAALTFLVDVYRRSVDDESGGTQDPDAWTKEQVMQQVVRALAQ